ILEGEGETRSSFEPAGRPFPTRLSGLNRLPSPLIFPHRGPIRRESRVLVEPLRSSWWLARMLLEIPRRSGSTEDTGTSVCRLALMSNSFLQRELGLKAMDDRR